MRQALAPVVEHRVFPLDSFPWPALDLEPTHTHLIVGQSGSGKTSYIKSRFPRIMMVSHLDQLSEYDPQVHEGILFDDMSFSHMPRPAQIHLVDVDDDRHIHIRYATALIPAGTLKIITSNVFDVFVADRAIERRVKVHDLMQYNPIE